MTSHRPQDCPWDITGDGYSSVVCVPDYSKDLHLKCFKSRRAQELTDTNCGAHMKCAKLLLQKFLQSATDFVFFMDERVFLVASRDNRQNDHIYTARDIRKHISATECLMFCHPMFSKSLMLSLTTSKLGGSPLIFHWARRKDQWN